MSASIQECLAANERERLRPPGILADFFDFHIDGAARQNAPLAQLTALVFGSVILGRRYVTDRGNWAMLYALGIANTGAGKERSRDALESVLFAAGLEARIGPRTYTSAAAVSSALQQAPVHLSIADEFGDALQGAQDRGQAHKKAHFALLREVFGMGARRDGGRLLPQAYATQNMSKAAREELSRIVERPSITLLGLSTPRQLTDALSGADLASGLLNRFLVVRAVQEARPMREDTDAAIPPKLVAWAKSHAALALGAVDAHDFEHPPEPVVVPFLPSGWEAIRALEARVIDRINDLARDGEGFEATWARCVEISMRVALIVAVAMGRNKIDSEAARWAADFVFDLTDQLQKLLQNNLAESEAERVSKRLLAVIQERPGVPLSQLARCAPLVSFKRRDRWEFLASLVESGEIRTEVTKHRGKQLNRYFPTYN